MIEILGIIAGSWPIAIMAVGIVTAIVVNQRLKQAMDNSQAVRDIKASQAVVVRNHNREVD